MNPANPEIVASKLYMPSRSARAISRPRLLGLLQEGLQYKLTLICAPAGFGKTTLVAEWLHSIELRSSWISLEAGDNDPARFWNYITSAIDLVYPGFKRKIRSVPLQTVDDAFVVTLLNMLNRLKHPLILVLDDFHVIENPAILKSFSYLISYIPAHVHIYITSRIDLKFPSARLESLGMMLRVELENLRFNVREGVDFYRTCMDIALTEEDAALLVQRTEGWIAGMKLAGITIRKQQQIPTFIRKSTGNYRLIDKYLLEEILE